MTEDLQLATKGRRVFTGHGLANLVQAQSLSRSTLLREEFTRPWCSLMFRLVITHRPSEQPWPGASSRSLRASAMPSARARSRRPSHLFEDMPRRRRSPALRAFEGVDGCAHHVNGGGGAHRLGQDVGDASAFHDGADRTAGDNAGTRSSRTQSHGASGIVADHRVVTVPFDARNGEHVLLASSWPLAIAAGTSRDLLYDTHGAVAVANHHEGGEAERTTTLVGLGHTVDGHHASSISFS